jgi:hypothetical protein
MKLVPGVFRRHHAFPVLGLIALCSLACSSSGNVGGEGGSGNAAPGGGAPPGVPGGGATSVPGGGTSSTGGSGGTSGVNLSNGGPKLRVLTQAEYTNSITDLLGAIKAPLVLPDDLFTSGFASIGGAVVSINQSAVTLYETATRAATAEVFGDATRWQKLVGCQPKVDLSDACVVTFIQTFGKRAFRRPLADTEVQKWLQLGKDTAQLASSASQGLAAITSGLLQSPYFLYRVETNKLDTASGRLKYDGLSMATRLSYLLTGHPPSEALLTAAAAGQLDTADGVKTAAAPLINDPSAVDRMAAFFNDFSQTRLVAVVQKDPTLFPNFTPTLQSSMLQSAQLFIKNIVLAPTADVRSFFDSDQTFVDATLAPIYGVTAPASGFAQVKLPPESGRAGILGQAAVLAGHSQADHNSPTRRGVFILEALLCTTPQNPPAGVITVVPDDPTLTARQRMEKHRTDASCRACHGLFDPLGFALEHFDSIGKYRATEGTLPIDATGTLDTVAFDGAAQLGTAFRGNERAMSCMMNSFYRNANGVPDATADATQVTALAQTLAAKNYVWRDLVAEFVVSDAFRSAPAAAATAGNQ